MKAEYVPEFARLLYVAAERLGAGSSLLCILGSYGDTLDDGEIMDMLSEYVDTVTDGEGSVPDLGKAPNKDVKSWADTLNGIYERNNVKAPDTCYDDMFLDGKDKQIRDLEKQNEELLYLSNSMADTALYIYASLIGKRISQVGSLASDVRRDELPKKDTYITDEQIEPRKLTTDLYKLHKYIKGIKPLPR